MHESPAHERDRDTILPSVTGMSPPCPTTEGPREMSPATIVQLIIVAIISIAVGLGMAAYGEKTRAWIVLDFKTTRGHLTQLAFSNPDTLNEDEFVFQPVGDMVRVREKRAGGIDVDQAGQNQAEVAARFALVDPSSMFVTVWTWSDSYGHFEPVRLALEGRHVKYELRPTAMATSVVLTNEDEEPPRVQ